MKVFVITKENLLRLGKYVGIYLVGISAGAFLGLLPLLALAAGLPIVLAERNLGRRAAQIVMLISLGVTWLLMDAVSFVYIGLGLMVGYSLAMIPEHVPFRFRLVQTAIAGLVWALLMNWMLTMLHGESLLSLITNQFQAALATTVESMQTMELYTAAQLAEFEQYGQVMLETLRNQWAYILFIYLLISTALTYALSRVFGPKDLPREDMLETKASLNLGIATVLLAGLHYLLPTVAPALVSNLWGIASLLTTLAGFLLLFYYLRFLRVGTIWRILLGLYLLTVPIAWRVLLLVGLFDSVFDYRFYARRRQQQQ